MPASPDRSEGGGSSLLDLLDRRIGELDQEPSRPPEPADRGPAETPAGPAADRGPEIPDGLATLEPLFPWDAPAPAQVRPVTGSLLPPPAPAPVAPRPLPARTGEASPTSGIARARQASDPPRHLADPPPAAAGPPAAEADHKAQPDRWRGAAAANAATALIALGVLLVLLALVRVL